MDYTFFVGAHLCTESYAIRQDLRCTVCGLEVRGIDSNDLRLRPCVDPADGVAYFDKLCQDEATAIGGW